MRNKKKAQERRIEMTFLCILLSIVVVLMGSMFHYNGNRNSDMGWNMNLLEEMMDIDIVDHGGNPITGMNQTLDGDGWIHSGYSQSERGYWISIIGMLLLGFFLGVAYTHIRGEI